jgi:hypothetical protein
MNRLNHLKHTLSQNILDNSSYKDLEFILLDYNSTDGLGSYVKRELAGYIKEKRLIYYYTPEPAFFNRSHSRNVVFKLASGDILVNIDADNFTGKDFANYVNYEFQKNNNIFLSTLHTRQLINKTDVLGRICVKKNDFMDIKGYDEKMMNYGFEDNDIMNRLELKGLINKPIINNPNYFQVISHSIKERINNEYPLLNLQNLLIRHLTPNSSEVVYLFKDKKVTKGIITDNKTYPLKHLHGLQQKHLQDYEFGVLGNTWIQGSWKYEKKNIKMRFDKYECLEYLLNEELKTYTEKASKQIYYLVDDENMIIESIMFFSQLSNRLILQKNLYNRIIKSNKNDFGKTIVYKNFVKQNLILV